MYHRIDKIFSIVMLFEIEQDDFEMLVYDEFYLLLNDVVVLVLHEFLFEIYLLL